MITSRNRLALLFATLFVFTSALVRAEIDKESISELREEEAKNAAFAGLALDVD